MENRIGKNSVRSKQYNRGLILQWIATGSCRTRIELSRKTKLTKMTVTNIVAEFMERNLVMECEEECTDVCGRNPILLKISPQAPKAIGLLIFRDRIEAVLCSLDMKILDKESIYFQTLTKEQLIQYSYDVLDRILKKEKNVLGIGVSTIGPVDIYKGIILNPPRFYGIENVNIINALKERYALPVYVEHDNTSAALAEYLYGTGKGVQDFIFLGISNGVGSGIVSHGELFHNHQGWEPEIGHMSIDRNGPLCSCGNRGCLETYVSSHVIMEKLKKITGKNVSYTDFCAMNRCEEIDQIFNQMIEDISVALINVINMIHPELIVLGHDCIDWNEKYIKLLENILNEKRMIHDSNRIDVRKAYFGKDAQLVGAATHIVNQVFKGNILFD